MSHVNVSDCSRRSFLTSVAAAGAGILVGLPFGRAHAQTSTAPAKPGASLPHLSPGDPLAQSLGYQEDAGKVDKAKFATYKAGQKCDNCRFFQGAAGQQYGPCQIFVGKAVNANGWCASYSAKT
jgi:hypothetical protein